MDLSMSRGGMKLSVWREACDISLLEHAGVSHKLSVARLELRAVLRTPDPRHCVGLPGAERRGPQATERASS